MLVSLACTPNSRAASQVADHVLSMSPRSALHEMSKAGQACISLSCCQPGSADQSALRQGGVMTTGGLTGSGPGHTAAVTGGQLGNVTSGITGAGRGVAMAGVGAELLSLTGAVVQAAKSATSAS